LAGLSPHFGGSFLPIGGSFVKRGGYRGKKTAIFFTNDGISGSFAANLESDGGTNRHIVDPRRAKTASLSSPWRFSSVLWRHSS
jgi:hypothetical protein